VDGLWTCGAGAGAGRVSPDATCGCAAGLRGNRSPA
jgi:hypothetical protein